MSSSSLKLSSKLYLLSDFHLQRLILSFVGHPDPIGAPVLVFIRSPSSFSAGVVEKEGISMYVCIVYIIYAYMHVCIVYICMYVNDDMLSQWYQ